MKPRCHRLALTGIALSCLFTLSSSFLPHQGAPFPRSAGWLARPLLPFPSSALTAAAGAPSSSGDDVELGPVPTEWQGDVLKQLKQIIDPDLGSDIVTLGFVQKLELDESTRTVKFDVELTTPACPVKDQFAADCERLVKGLPWVSVVDVTMTAQEPTTQQTDTSGMANVGAVVAVSSCKGGVGKSTTAVNLAFSLQKLGANVGILDADVYGPSLPTMVTPDDDIVRFVGRQIAPLQRNGVKLMSFGYVNDGSAVMRGPMVTQLLDQFLAVTNWGSLDYLILDMPPGTGDIQLTLTQRLNITAAVIVTTPQELSYVDVERGIEMFDSVNVPCVAVVENMAYYEVPEPSVDRAKLKQSIAEKLREESEPNGETSTHVDQLADALVDVVVQQMQSPDGTRTKVPIFGPGHKHKLADQWGIEHTYSMPLLDKIAANGDSGVPFVVENPDTTQTKIYNELAKSVVTEVAKAKYTHMRPVVTHDQDRNVIRISSGSGGDDELSAAEEISSADLRRGCRCAACVEEMTGRQILLATDISESIQPRKMSPTGNYALSVDWSDGHRSLYPYRQIRSLIQSKKESISAAERSREKAIA